MAQTPMVLDFWNVDLNFLLLPECRRKVIVGLGVTAMAMMKRLMEQQEEQDSVATGIAIEARVLKRCEIHGDQVWDVSGDHSSAYKLGNWKFTNGKLPEGLFSDRKELADAIQRAIKNSGMECGICAKYRDE